MIYDSQLQNICLTWHCPPIFSGVNAVSGILYSAVCAVYQTACSQLPFSSNLSALQIIILHKAEQLLFSPLVKDAQHTVQLPAGLGMQKIMTSAPLKILQRIMLSISFFVIILGSADSVHQHLRHIFPGHLHRLQRILISGRMKGIIQPEFKMMAVPALMMEPCKGIALILTLAVVRTALSVLIIHAALNELRRHIF